MNLLISFTSNIPDPPSVPCTPENVSSVVECEASSLVVSWSESSGADSYVATVQDSSGQTTTCQATSQGWCSVAGIGCGQIYHATVASSDGYCDSPPSYQVHTPSGRTAGCLVDQCVSLNLMSALSIKRYSKNDFHSATFSKDKK